VFIHKLKVHQSDKKNDMMCSVVEIKTPNEIYIHYLSQNCSDEEDQSVQNIRRISIKDNLENKGSEVKSNKCSDNTSRNVVNITHIKKECVRNKSSDAGDNSRKDEEQTSDRASSMGSSIIDSLEIFEKIDVTVNSLTIVPLGVTVDTRETATQVETVDRKRLCGFQRREGRFLWEK
jgi:hypothetical protein